MKIRTYLRVLWLLMAMMAMNLFTAPAFAHGGVVSPPSRSIYCENFRSGANWPPDGSAIPDLACRQAMMAAGALSPYILTQWHQVSINVTDYNNIAAVKAAIADGHLCSANFFPDLKGLDLSNVGWHRTAVKPAGGKLRVVWDAPAPHEPDVFFQYYLTKSTYNPSQPLTWNDLDLIYSVPGPSHSTPGGAYRQYVHEVPIPAGRTGDAILYSRFQRKDKEGEGFYNCSDITLEGGGTPTFPWHEEKQFIPVEIAPQPGQKVLFRVMGHARDGTEIINQSLNITTDNASPQIWGKQLAGKVVAAGGSHALIGQRSGNTIVYDEANYRANKVWLADARDQSFMAVAPGDGTPGAPVAKITGPTSVTAGQAATFSGTTSTGTAPLSYHWTAPQFSDASSTSSSIQVTAPQVTAPTPATVTLTVKDASSRENTVTHAVTINPGGGGSHPAYPAGKPYKAGDIVSNQGKNYRCKPWPYTDWCSGSADAYAPGTGRAWTEAWELVP